jgi:hypothetical protein
MITPAVGSEKSQRLATTGKFYYKPGDRLPFWYKNVETHCDLKNARCVPFKVTPSSYVLESTIAEIKDPNTDHAALLTVEGSCMRRRLGNALSTEMGRSETCGHPGNPIKGIGTAVRADCTRGTMMTLSGFEYALSPSSPDNENPYVVEDIDGHTLEDSVRLRTTVEQFKALCPAKVIEWHQMRDGFGENQ